MLKSGETGTHTCTNEQTHTNAAAKICLPAVETAGAINSQEHINGNTDEFLEAQFELPRE